MNSDTTPDVVTRQIRRLAARAAACLMAFSAFQGAVVSAAELGGAELDRIGRGIWRNECNGTVDGLTSWNAGENFASLGIGHFIWYPKGVEGPFEESFPKLVAWMKAEGAALPGWLLEARHCPWADRTAFLRDHDSAPQRELRKLLSMTMREQTRFIVRRLDASVPRFEKAAGVNGNLVVKNIAWLRQSAAGNFALIDYVNFKGDGLNPKERYRGEGWGLLQVLEVMDSKTGGYENAAAEFADAAKRVLTRRVKNSPPERDERRWLEGWKNRCDSYTK